jgi:hypothetical protein
MRAQEEDDDAIANRLKIPEVKSALESLKQRGVFTIQFDGKTTCLNFNLDAALPTPSQPSQPSRPSRDTNLGGS